MAARKRASRKKPVKPPAPTEAPAPGLFDPPAPVSTPTPAAPAAPAPAAKVRGRLAAVRTAMSKPKLGLLAALTGGALGSAAVAGLLRTKPDTSELERAVNDSVRVARGEKVARILEQARAEKSLAQNQARLAQADPTLYTSIMAGRRVPSGAVVLGGRPRMDLMKELAASMDSGRFAQKDPLSDLMG